MPLLALAVGGWLVYKAISEKGPTVTISFKSAAGLEAGKTKIKYKDVELGQVVSIELDDGLSQVIVKAEMVKRAENFLSENTRFWVRPGRGLRPAVFPGSALFFRELTSDWIRANPANWQRISRGWRYLQW